MYLFVICIWVCKLVDGFSINGSQIINVSDICKNQGRQRAILNKQGHEVGLLISNTEK